MTKPDPSIARSAAACDRARGPAPWLLAVGLGLTAAVLYVLLRRATSHEYDVYWLLPRLHRGELAYPRHPLSLYAASLWATLLEPFGGDLHERLRIASGLCTGLAVAVFTHAAWLLLRSRRAAATVGVLYACLPANAYFATVMELHALFLPAAAVAVWFACWLIGRGERVGVTTGAGLGVLTSLASGLHSTGHLLVPLLAAWLVAELHSQRSLWPRLLRGVGAFGIAHAAVYAVVQWMTTRGDASAPVAAQLGFLADSLQGFTDLHRTIVGEWLLPFCPVAIVCWFGWRASRALVLCLFGGCVAHIAVCQILLVLPGGGYVFHEFGAYQQTLAFFATVVAVRVVGRWAPALVLVALAVASQSWLQPAKQPADRAFGAAALQHMASSGDRLLVGCFAEFDGVFDLAWHDDQRSLLLPRLLGVNQFRGEVLQGPSCTAAELALFFHPAVAHLTTVLTQAARDQLRDAGGIFAELVEVALPATFVLREVVVAGTGGELRGWRLEPK